MKLQAWSLKKEKHEHLLSSREIKKLQDAVFLSFAHIKSQDMLASAASILVWIIFASFKKNIST